MTVNNRVSLAGRLGFDSRVSLAEGRVTDTPGRRRTHAITRSPSNNVPLSCSAVVHSNGMAFNLTITVVVEQDCGTYADRPGHDAFLFAFDR